jgi:hypothetical protein
LFSAVRHGAKDLAGLRNPLQSPGDRLISNRLAPGAGAQAPVAPLSDEDLSLRTADLVAMGFKSFDAFHLASAELSGADVFLTVDLPLLKIATRLSEKLHIRVADPVNLLEELSQWAH